jgi:hypothetical protein
VKTDSPIGVKIQDSVAVTFQIPLNRMSDFQSQLKEIVPVVSEKNLKIHKSMKPKLLNVPSYATVLKIDSIQSGAN